MANVVLQVANPKSVDVTVNAQVAKANQITALTIDNATTDAYGFLAAGCVLAANAATVEQREQGGFLIEAEQHDVH